MLACLSRNMWKLFHDDFTLPEGWPDDWPNTSSTRPCPVENTTFEFVLESPGFCNGDLLVSLELSPWPSGSLAFSPCRSNLERAHKKAVHTVGDTSPGQRL